MAKASHLPKFEARRPVSDLEHVYHQLKQSFMIGEFTPGQKLTLPELALAFGTSQMPIREATNRLIAARAIEALPRRSLRVPAATMQRLEALLPLRLHLEGEATRLAVEAGCKAIAPELDRINSEMYAKEPQENIKAYLRLNQRFHFTIYQQCGNDDLVDLIELLWMRYGPIMNIVRSGVLSRSGQIRHAEVIEAIKQGNADKATAAIRADIKEAAGPIGEAIAAAARTAPRAGT